MNTLKSIAYVLMGAAIGFLFVVATALAIAGSIYGGAIIALAACAWLALLLVSD